MAIQNLPAELLDAIMGQLARLPAEKYSYPQGFKALHIARLVCHDWNRAASPHLFRILQLKHGPPPPDANKLPRSSSEVVQKTIFERWHDTLDLDVARHAARTIIVDTMPKDFPYSTLWEVWQKWETEADAKFEGFDDALGRIAELPNLEAVEVCFHENCAGEESSVHNWKVDYEPLTARRNSLKAVFRAIHERKLKAAGGRQHGSTITSLALKNLQNIADTEFENSSLFKSVMEDIRHFHLHIATEYNERGPDYDLYKIERVRFEPDLQSGLLLSVDSQLTTLTLSFNEDWGTMPGYFDGYGLYFPKLRTLHLCLFAISHDNHLDWILRMPALTSLYLSQTRIMTHAKVNEEHINSWNLQTRDWERLPSGAYGFDREDVVFTYAGRWHSFFDRMRLELNSLTDFRISWADDIWFDGIKAPWTQVPKPDAAPELSFARYMVFDSGLCPSPWIYPNYAGDMDFGYPDDNRNASSNGEDEDDAAEKFKAEDQKALQELLEATWARRLREV